MHHRRLIYMNAAAPQDWVQLAASLPAYWVWAVAVVAIVALVVCGWLAEKWMANRLTANIVGNFGPGCLPELTRHHQASSMTVVADVLTSSAGLVKAIGEVAGNGGKDVGAGGGPSPPDA